MWPCRIQQIDQFRKATTRSRSEHLSASVRWAEMMPVVMARAWITDLACQRTLHCSVQRTQKIGVPLNYRLAST